MQSHYPEQFERDMGCTEAEWLRCLPAAIGTWPWVQDGHSVWVDFSQAQTPERACAQLHIAWQVLPPRTIALMRLPRLGVRFAFSGLEEISRQAFMRRFDLHMQRGGG